MLERAFWALHIWDYRALGNFSASTRQGILNTVEQRMQGVPTFPIWAGDHVTFLDGVLLGCRRFRDWSAQSGQPITGACLDYNPAS